MADLNITFSNRDDKSKQPLKLNIKGLSQENSSSISVLCNHMFDGNSHSVELGNGCPKEFAITDFLYSKLDEIRKCDGNDSDLTVDDFKNYYKKNRVKCAFKKDVVYDGEGRNFYGILNRNINMKEYIFLHFSENKKDWSDKLASIFF